jgi:hypothetical protein
MKPDDMSREIHRLLQIKLESTKQVMDEGVPPERTASFNIELKLFSEITRLINEIYLCLVGTKGEYTLTNEDRENIIKAMYHQVNNYLFLSDGISVLGSLDLIREAIEEAKN